MYCTLLKRFCLVPLCYRPTILKKKYASSFVSKENLMNNLSILSALIFLCKLSKLYVLHRLLSLPHRITSLFSNYNLFGVPYVGRIVLFLFSKRIDYLSIVFSFLLKTSLSKANFFSFLSYSYFSSIL